MGQISSMFPLPCISLQGRGGGRYMYTAVRRVSKDDCGEAFSDLIRSSPPDLSTRLYACMSCMHTTCFANPSSNRCCHLTHVGRTDYDLFSRVCTARPRSKAASMLRFTAWVLLQLCSCDLQCTVSVGTVAILVPELLVFCSSCSMVNCTLIFFDILSF